MSSRVIHFVVKTLTQYPSLSTVRKPKRAEAKQAGDGDKPPTPQGRPKKSHAKLTASKYKTPSVACCTYEFGWRFTMCRMYILYLMFGLRSYSISPLLRRTSVAEGHNKKYMK